MNQTTINKDQSNKKLLVIRQFDAPLPQVWKAWTERELLDQWWAPRPWKANTKFMDFREGGYWLYAMEGPEGEKQWCRADYHSIEPQKRFTGNDAFCDEQGNPTNEAPSMQWDVRFFAEGDATRVEVTVSFATEDDLEKIVEMGFKEGFTAAHGNLDELLAKELAG